MPQCNRFQYLGVNTLQYLGVTKKNRVLKLDIITRNLYRARLGQASRVLCNHGEPPPNQVVRT